MTNPRLWKLLVLTLPVTLCVGCADDSGADDSASGTDASTTGDNTTGTSSTKGDETSGVPPTMKKCADPDDVASPKEGVMGEIKADTTWTCDKVYFLEEVVTVKGATLTIEAGTTIKGLDKSALVIEKDATIEAVGTAAQPIVFTSSEEKGTRHRGDWGGLVLLGKAQVNIDGGTSQTEGFMTPYVYGGTDAKHDCGTLQYVRIEWAGVQIAPGNEVNGITFYACGTDTTVDHVQVHMGQDDGIEFFGGAFHAHHVVLTGEDDDALDCDQGFQGSLQYVLVHQDPANRGDNGLEWSNQGTDFAAPPLTGPKIANLTFVGSGATGNTSRGATFKEGTNATILNSLFTNSTVETFLLQNKATQTRAEMGGIVVNNTAFFDNGKAAKFGGDAFNVDAGKDMATWAPADFKDFIMDAANENLADMDPMLPSIEWTKPDVLPPSGSPLKGAGGKLSAPFEDTDYIGAVEPGAKEDWTKAAWINYAVK